MKLKPNLRGGILAIALTVLTASSARATNSAQYNDGDWLLGFYDTSNNTNFVLDLGPHATNKSFTVSDTTSFLAHDLSTAFGSSWFGNSDVYYAVLQTFNTPGTILITNPDPAEGPWASGGTNGPSDDIATLGGQFSQKPQVTGQESTGLDYPSTTTNSWYSFASPNGTNGGLGGNYTNLDDVGDGDFSDLTSDKLQLDYLQNPFNSVAQIVGEVSLDSSGDFTFTTAAVPEPSTPAAIALGAVFLIFVHRRRRDVA